jgi:hypothetical protein
MANRAVETPRLRKTTMRFFSQLFSESGEASYGRTASFMALLMAMGWISYLVWKTHELPHLEGVTAFISMLYGLSKTGETVQRVMGKKQ